MIWLLLLAGAILVTTFLLPFDVNNLGILARTPRWWGIPLWLVQLMCCPLGTVLLGVILYRLWWITPAGVRKTQAVLQAATAACRTAEIE
jgi:hypothetical protein